VAPESLRGYGGGPSYRELVHGQVLFNRPFQREGLRVARRYYTDARTYDSHRPVIGALRAWESVTRIDGPIFVLFAVLSLAGPVILRGRARSASLLFTLTAWTLLVLPVATVEFSARTAVPGFGALGAAAALGGWRVLQLVRIRRGSQTARIDGSPQPV
jgi:hypothetical protein